MSFLFHTPKRSLNSSLWSVGLVGVNPSFFSSKVFIVLLRLWPFSLAIVWMRLYTLSSRL